MRGDEEGKGDLAKRIRLQDAASDTAVAPPISPQLHPDRCPSPPDSAPTWLLSSSDLGRSPEASWGKSSGRWAGRVETTTRRTCGRRGASSLCEERLSPSTSSPAPAAVAAVPAVEDEDEDEDEAAAGGAGRFTSASARSSLMGCAQTWHTKLTMLVPGGGGPGSALAVGGVPAADWQAGRVRVRGLRVSVCRLVASGGASGAGDAKPTAGVPLRGAAARAGVARAPPPSPGAAGAGVAIGSPEKVVWFMGRWVESRLATRPHFPVELLWTG